MIAFAIVSLLGIRRAARDSPSFAATRRTIAVCVVIARLQEIAYG
jgi:hypothetical protein